MKPYLIFKRGLDFIFALLLLLLFSPIMIIAALLIKINSKGPILFSQERPGKNEKIFKVYKFRTMKLQLESNRKPIEDKKRITSIGGFLRKTSIDELPQLINVIKGEMSFIGPRPLLVQYLELYNEEQRNRHKVIPGISGWAQVNGRNLISWEEKFKYDIYYVNNISWKLDLKILCLTVYKVLKRKDINNSNENTMPYFNGNDKTDK